VVGQDGGQRLGVFQKALDGAFGQRGESLVRGREDGERAFARQRFDEARGLDGGDERGEAAGLDGGFDDVHAAMGICEAGAARAVVAARVIMSLRMCSISFVGLREASSAPRRRLK
jgi:hypothetical protein